MVGPDQNTWNRRSYADLRSLTARQRICLLVLFLLSCILSCLIVGII